MPDDAAHLGRDALAHLTIRGPSYDRSAVSPGILHFGLGPAHRGHQAAYLHTLMQQGLAHDFGIVGVEVSPDGHRTVQDLRRQDSLYTVLVERRDGTLDATVIGSLHRVLWAPEDHETVLDLLADPSIRIVSLTLGADHYPVDPDTGAFDPRHATVRDDLEPDGPPQGVLGFLLAGLRRRHDAGTPPFAVLSCDDLAGNGDITRRMLTSLARSADPELAEWVDRQVAFPGSTVDRATAPATAAQTRRLREDHGVIDACAVAAEPFSQWAVEDDFPLGRPPFEHAQISVTDNIVPFGLLTLRLHGAARQAASWLAYLAGHHTTDELVGDPLLVDFLRRHMRDEVLPTLPAVPGLDVEGHCRALIERLADSSTGPAGSQELAQVCRNGSDHLPRWLVPLIEDNVRARVPVERSALVLASWARYAEGTDDHGRPLEVIDPLREPLTAIAARHDEDLLALLRNPVLFGSLIDTPEFVRPYREALDALRTHGVRHTLETFTPAPGHP